VLFNDRLVLIAIGNEAAEDHGGSATGQPYARTPSSVQGTFMPVENKQVMHVYEMHHVMAHLPKETLNIAEIIASVDFRKLLWEFPGRIFSK